MGEVVCGEDDTTIRGAPVECCCIICVDGGGVGDFFDKFNGCGVSAISTCNSNIRGDAAADGGDWRGGDVDDVECGDWKYLGGSLIDIPAGDGVCCRVVVITDKPVEFCQRFDDENEHCFVAEAVAVTVLLAVLALEAKFVFKPDDNAQTKSPPCCELW